LVKLFIELIKNAANSCSCLKDRSGHIQIKAKQMGNFCFVDIEDNGVGIKSEWLKRLFDPFFTTAEVGHGMGLGLTYCYDIIKHHKGEIEIKNREEYGVVVTITLPCVTKEIS
jgi:signal transduction histidine kinase